MLPYITAVLTVFSNKRKCPKCKRNQVVEPSKRQKEVPCKFCGSKIPPPKR